jgi:hypothetical protein
LPIADFQLWPVDRFLLLYCYAEKPIADFPLPPPIAWVLL